MITNESAPILGRMAGSSDASLGELSTPDDINSLLWQLSSTTERRELLAAQSSSYKVQPGDTLNSIAADHGVSLEALIAANPQIDNPNLVYPDQVVHIPRSSNGDATVTGSTTIEDRAIDSLAEQHVSDAGLDFITEHEGIRLRLYNDPAGHATIGVGHLVHFGPVDGRASEAPFANGITRAEAMALLRQDVGAAEAAIRRLVDVPLNQNQFDALVSFVFNVGAGNFERSTLLTRLNQGDYAAVPGELNRWTRGGGEILPGLVRRRQAEGELFSAPVNDAPPVTVPRIILRNGSRGASVSTLQTLLYDKGFNPGAVDGVFGARTEAAVRVFQQSAHLVVDGIVGPNTWRALMDMPADSPVAENGTPSRGAEGSMADIWVKSTANIENLAPEIEAALDDVVAVWSENRGPTPVITSANDGRHMNGSRHYNNLAIDLRANNISDSQARDIAADLQARLGNDYDVLFEHFPGNPANDHIHLEYDPN